MKGMGLTLFLYIAFLILKKTNGGNMPLESLQSRCCPWSSIQQSGAATRESSSEKRCKKILQLSGSMDRLEKRTTQWAQNTRRTNEASTLLQYQDPTISQITTVAKRLRANSSELRQINEDFNPYASRFLPN
uniref:Putative secreted protein n=1 Tax=Ixodes ricinus TaxID=34613 RepID=A0A6B0URB7_IXORI